MRVVLFCSVQILIACTVSVIALVANRAHYIRAFWTGDLVGHFFIILLIVGLIQRTVNKPQATWALAGCAVVFALVSAYMFYSPHLNRWMTPLSRNLSFLEEALAFVLWSIILHKGASDHLLLMVSLGIVVQVTGEVIGHTLRLYSQDRSTVWVPSLLVSVAELLCLAIWIYAFHSMRSTRNVRRSA